MSSQPTKESEKSRAPSKPACGTVATSSVPEAKQGERAESVPTHEGGAGEGQREAGKVVTAECMQRMERRLDDVCALLEALVTGRRVGEGAGHVEYTPSPGGAS
ncbi:hypothetical protein LPJ73_002392, partial [Coemansia sp. RSA 2703]